MEPPVQQAALALGANMEAFERMNFLYQAAHQTALVNPNLARFYSSTMQRISQKLVLRMSPELKSTLCKCCASLLTLGHSASIRVSGKRKAHLVFHCHFCGSLTRRFLPRKAKSERVGESKRPKTEELSLEDSVEPVEKKDT